jgi:hypothetical protein
MEDEKEHSEAPLQQLVYQVFCDADDAHIDHLRTRSYAEHMALGEFYEAARAAVDDIIEAGIGLGLALPDKPDKGPLQQLTSAYKKLETLRPKVCGQDPTLLNLYDTLTHVYARAIYKLTRFS